MPLKRHSCLQSVGPRVWVSVSTAVSAGPLSAAFLEHMRPCDRRQPRQTVHSHVVKAVRFRHILAQQEEF